MCWSVYVTSTKTDENGFRKTLFEAVSGSYNRAYSEAKEWIDEQGLEKGQYTIEAEDTSDKYE